MHKILIVDDQAATARLLASLLKLDGFEAEQLKDWQNLVGEIRSRRPDLLILDVHLPGVDGFELLRQIRSHPEHSVANVPVLIISALDYGHNLEASGADGFLLKPFNHASLLEAMDGIKKERAAQEKRMEAQDDVEGKAGAA